MIRKTVIPLSVVITFGMLIALAAAQSPGRVEKNDKHRPASVLSEPAESQETILASEKGEPSVDIVIQSPDDDLINLNLLDVDIREALTALAMEREINIATGKGVSGNISLHLYQATLKDALDAITLAGGFSYRKRESFYYVYKPKEMRDPQFERLKMRIFKIEYAELDKIHEILDSIPGTRLIKIHEASRTVIVEDTPENIQKIETIIKYWDTMPRQVMIEAKILSVDLTDDMSFGIDWDKILNDVRIATGGFSSAVLPDGQDVSPAPGTGTGIFGNILVGAGTSHQFSAAIDALQTKTRVNTLSTPKVLAIHGRPAKVQVGGQQGYRLTTVNQGISTESIEFIDTGIVLEITPYIDDEGNVLLYVMPSITQATLEAGIPVTNTALVSTYLLAKSGETVLIGGLIQDTKIKNIETVPCLGDIPILGVLFGRRSRSIDKEELVVLITLQVLDNKQIRVDQAEAIEKTRKMENNFKREPLPSHKQIMEFVLPDTDPFEQIREEPKGESKTGDAPSNESSTSADHFDYTSF
jgi:type II secretory pathway component GspD/PulD (secretin)